MDGRRPEPAEGATAPARSVRSFVVRAGRTSQAQRAALQTLLPHYGLADGDGPIDFTALFGRRAPRVVEIGFGNGATLVEMARMAPEQDFLGIEVYPPGIGHCLQAAHAEGLTNLRVAQADAVALLRNRVPDGALDRVQVYFPDPWPKKRHHKRRLIQPEFLSLLAAKVRPGGHLHLATDWAPYAEAMLAHLEAAQNWRNTAPAPECFVRAAGLRPTTKFETRGKRLGHGVWDILFVREGSG